MVTSSRTYRAVVSGSFTVIGVGRFSLNRQSGWVIHWPDQSLAEVRPVSNQAGSLQSDAPPCALHTRTRQ